MNRDMGSLYKSILQRLEAIQNNELAEKKANNSEIAKQEAQKNNRIQALERKISELLPYQKTAGIYVSSILQSKKFMPLEPDVRLLETLYSSASQGGANWNSIYEMATSGIEYYESKKRQIIQEKPINNKELEITRRADQACEKVLLGENVSTLSDIFKEYDQQYAPALFVGRTFSISEWDVPFPFGKVAMPFPVTDGCIELAKRKLGVYFIETSKSILMPGSVAENVVLIQAHTKLIDSVMKGIRAYIINLLYHSGPITEKIFYIDTCTLDKSALGILKALEDKDHTIIAPVIETIDDAKKRLEAFRNLTDTKPGNRLLVYRYRQSSYDHGCDTVLQWACANANHYGFKVFVVQELSNGETDLDKLIPDYFPDQTRFKLFQTSQENNWLEEAKQHKRIVWYSEPDVLPDEFCSTLFEAYKPKSLDTRYFSINKDYNKLSYRRNRKNTISLLYGIDENGKQYKLELRGMDFACFILGASRSGKSNLLNILITSAILSYHPDDLELWLVDFGRTEFKRYTKHIPPHVRYILIEKTTELVCSLVDKLIEEMDRRGRIMSNNNVLEISDLPETIQMPRILVIIDEFGAFKEILTSDSFEDKRLYRDYMARLLRQGAKHGISFIFADQSFTDTYKALPEEGQEQIGLRLTMLAKPDEMKSILGVKGTQLTADEDSEIRRLPKYQVLYRGRETGEKLIGPVRVLYFNEADQQKQLELIDSINNTLRPVAQNRNDPINTYYDHDHFCLDRDERPCFSQQHDAIKLHLGEWKQNPASQESDLLLFLGEPRNLTRLHHELLCSERSENVLIYGNYAKNLLGLTEIIYSAIRSAAIQNYPVEFWCHDRDSIAKQYVGKWNVGKVFSKNKLLDHITQLEEELKNRTIGKRLIVVLGISSIIDSIKDDLDEKIALGEDQHQYDMQEEIRRIAAIREGRETERVKQTISIAESVIHSDENYDIQKGINNLLDWGPRYGIHFMVVVQKETELSDAGINIDEFTQFAGFASGIGDAQSFRMRRFIERISESDMFGYMSGNTSTTYMPFKMDE